MTNLDNPNRFFQENGWLSCVTDAFREALLGQAMARRYGQGAVIYRQGDRPNGLYGLFKGGIAFMIAPYERGPNYAHLIRPGFWFGEMEILSGGPRAYTLVATRPSICLFVPRDRLEAVAAVDPRGWYWMGALCAQHLDIAIGAIDDLMIRSNAHRVAAVLLRLAGGREDDNPNEQHPEIDASQEDVARMVNLGRATITECLGELEAAGLIARGYRRIRVLDQAGLRRLLAP